MIKKILFYTLIIGAFSLIIFSIVTDPNTFYTNIINSLSVWLYNVYPALFTFYIISSCLINFNIIKKISFVVKPFIRFSSQKSYELFITSIFVGNPSSTSLIMNELDNETIPMEDANKLLKVCSFFNPLYIIAIVSGSYLFSIKYAFIIMISILLANLLVGLFIKSKRNSISNKPIFNHQIKLDVIFNAINQAMSILLLVAGIMVFANILKFSFLSFLKYFNIEGNLINIFASLFEISTGLVDLFTVNPPLIILMSLASAMFAFQGFSVNMQVLNIINDRKIKFLPIFLTRFFQGIVAGCITFIILNII